jgi:hypothetical protein
VETGVGGGCLRGNGVCMRGAGPPGSSGASRARTPPRPSPRLRPPRPPQPRPRHAPPAPPAAAPPTVSAPDCLGDVSGTRPDVREGVSGTWPGRAFGEGVARTPPAPPAAARRHHRGDVSGMIPGSVRDNLRAGAVADILTRVLGVVVGCAG